MEEAMVTNGCMWFVPNTHKADPRTFKHEAAVVGKHVLTIKDTTLFDETGVAVPLPPGSCTVHPGNTVHRTLGNVTYKKRRALIANYRPKEMVKWEREHGFGFDHGKEGLENVILTNEEQLDSRYVQKKNP